MDDMERAANEMNDAARKTAGEAKSIYEAYVYL